MFANVEITLTRVPLCSHRSSKHSRVNSSIRFDRRTLRPSRVCAAAIRAAVLFWMMCGNCSSANHTTEYLPVRTARPAARLPHPFFELQTHSFDRRRSCLIFLDGDCQQIHSLRANGVMSYQAPVLSHRTRAPYGDQPEGYVRLNGCHRVTSQAKGSGI